MATATKPARFLIAPDVTKVDLACGANKRDGFFGIDIAAPEADLRHDLMNMPWPIADGQIEEFHCSHFVEHLPARADFLEDELCMFLNEVYRCLRKPEGEPGEDDHIPGGVITIIHPFLRSHRAFQDPTHRRFIPPETWTLYTQRAWREANGLGHYPLTCDFEPSVVGNLVDQSLQTRAPEVRDFFMRNYWDQFSDLVVTLRAR